MFCPSCGAKNSTDQRFCRSCGLNLEPAAKSLLEQMGSSYGDDPTERGRRLERFGNFAFGGFLVAGSLAVLGLIYVILDRMVLSGSQPLMGIFVMFFVIFAVLSLVYVIFRENLSQESPPIKRSAPPELQTAVSTSRLLDESHFQPIPAVTEDTTELLTVSKREK